MLSHLLGTHPPSLKGVPQSTTSPQGSEDTNHLTSLPRYLSPPTPPFCILHCNCVLQSCQPPVRSKPWRMPLELSSPVRSEGHGSSTDHRGRKQRNLPLVQRHRLVHLDPPSPKASRHTQDNQLTPQSESDRSTRCGPGVSPPAPTSPSLAFCSIFHSPRRSGL